MTVRGRQNLIVGRKSDEGDTERISGWWTRNGTGSEEWFSLGNFHHDSGARGYTNVSSIWAQFRIAEINHT